MKRIYITFSGASYDVPTEKIVTDAPKFGADEVVVYDDLWLTKQEFFTLNKWLWKHVGPGNPNGEHELEVSNTARGFGWFAWKPFCILDALSKVNDGDVVLYTDGDTYPIADLTCIFEHCKKLGGTMLFAATGCKNQHWVKRDAFLVMSQDEPRYHEADHAVARFMLFEKGPWRNQQFLMEWLTYCVNPTATTFDESVLGPELEGFKESRSEQAIFTLLALKYGHKLHREACQFGHTQPEDQDIYPTLFHQEGRKAAQTLEGSKFRNV